MRTPAWLQDKCKEIVEKELVMEFLGEVAGGKNCRQEYVPAEGKFMPAPAPTKERITAAELLLAYGFGKPSQSLAVDFTDKTPNEDADRMKRVEAYLEELVKR